MVAQASNCRLAGFGIRRAARAGVADGLYANGRHQYEVIIDVVKEVIDAKGEWAQAPLTDEERASVTVVEWSESLDQPLTQGWHCDETKNEFTLGLWRGKSPEAEQSIELAEADNSLVESIKRYLRCDTDAPIGPVVLMARIMIGGGWHATNGFRKTAGFEPSITLSSVRPIELSETDLEMHMDLWAYYSEDRETHVHVFYWTPPAGMWIVENQGFDNPLVSPGQGKDFRSVISYTIPMTGEGSRKIGTFVNKNSPDIPLDLDEIHVGLSGGAPSPSVRFDQRPTIMRLVRLTSSLKSENQNTKSLWQLLDNYGNEHRYSVWASDGMGLPGVPTVGISGGIFRPLKIVRFLIMLTGGGIVTDDLYANGRHQCKVIVEIEVEQVMPDGSSVPARLSDAERNSVTVTRYSSNVHEPLPPGWSCDQQKNIYDTGRWTTGIDELVPDQYINAMAGRSQRQREVVERYMRVEPNVAIEEQRFMASVTINGVTYTTNSRAGDVSFDTYVTIHPVRPYQLRAQDLTEYVDVHAYNDEYYDMDVYYWTPPGGLHFIVNKGFDTPLSIRREGNNFQTTFFNRRGAGFYRKGGVVVNKDVASPVVSLDDIFLAGSSNREKIVRFNQRPTIMRAVRAHVTMFSDGSADSNSKWRLWDNYGCEHVFGLEQQDDADRIKLVDG